MNLKDGSIRCKDSKPALTESQSASPASQAAAADTFVRALS
jgi:hypothetical protein